ncbi:MAG: hypothetical protein ACHQ2Z_10575 [Elusimicrobiota bacterium]
MPVKAPRSADFPDFEGSSLSIAARRISALILGTFLVLTAGEAADRAYWFAASPRPASDVFQLYVIGESTAVGVPFNPHLDIAAIVSRLFGGRIHGRRIEIVNIAVSGSTIYPQAIALERRARYRPRDVPGALFIYSGHNDSVVWNQVSRGRAAAWCAVLLRRSWLLTDILLRAERAGVFVGPRSLATYSENMRRAVDIGREAGLIPVVSTVIGNVVDIEPALRKPPDMTWKQLLRTLAQGDRLEKAHRFSDAADYYQSLKRRKGAPSAYLNYRTAQCYRRLGDFATARRLFWGVIDSGSNWNFGRATEAQNDLVRALARERSAFLVDAVKIFASRSEHGLIGTQWFMDGQHPNLEGYLLLSKGYARELSRAVNQPLSGTVVSADELARLFHLGPAEMIDAHLSSGQWALAVSREHADPRERLRMARWNFESVLALDPRNTPAWLGLAVADAARKSGVLVDKNELAWLDHYQLIAYAETYSFSKEELREIIGHFRLAGVSPRILRGIAEGGGAS